MAVVKGRRTWVQRINITRRCHIGGSVTGLVTVEEQGERFSRCYEYVVLLLVVCGSDCTVVV